MKKIATLGPKGTYCDIAVKRFLEDNMLDYEIEYYPSIIKTANALEKTDLAIIPFENTLDGFVVEGLDQIIKNHYWISQQIKLDIDFAFVSNSKNLDTIKNCYCQFKAYGQCLDFIAKNNFNIITTESNGESLDKVITSNEEYAAIIPMHLAIKNNFNINISHVADSKNNETRFFIISKERKKIELNDNMEASIVIESFGEDRPGTLYDILRQFHDEEINLKSIMSRPMKTEMGKYKFYFECTVNSSNVNKLNNIKNNIEKTNSKVTILGIYSSI